MKRPFLSRSRDILPAILLTPLSRIAEVPLYGKILGVVAGLVSWIFADLLAGILALLVLSGALDYILGRHIAKRRGVYDPLLAQAGALSKLSAILMLALLRGFEFWATAHTIPGIGATHGAISAALATGLFVLDLESIEHHRTFIGARPIPGFSHVVAWLRAIETRLLPVLPSDAPAPPPRRRRAGPT